jgi:hypothetical protein
LSAFGFSEVSPSGLAAMAAVLPFVWCFASAICSIPFEKIVAEISALVPLLISVRLLM